VLATIATIIASQSIITGAFSMTRQAIQLGWLPRLKITQTSAEGYGQIYVGAVNWTLMMVTCGLALGFGKSDNLAAAYGIAVSATMLATSALLFIAMREIWGWGIIRAGGIAGAFIIVDLTFFAANSSKIASGGYVPLLLAAFAYGIMLIWHRGAKAVSARLQEAVVPIGAFMADIAQRQIPRVPGTAVFLTRTKEDVPPLMVWHLNHSRALHQRLFVLTVDTESVPWVNDASRLAMTELPLSFGVRRPDMDSWSGLIFLRCLGRPMPAAVASIFLTSPIMLATKPFSPARMAKVCRNGWRLCFVMMQRNSTHLSEYARLPSDAVVEIGRQISI
jgi:KUP system potassium uptake protein